MYRWYDKHEKLGRNIDQMKEMDKPQLDRILRGIFEEIKGFNPTLLDDFVLDFPMDMYQKRWYDKDPYLWLTINGLSYGNKDLWDAVAFWMEQEKQRVEDLMASQAQPLGHDALSKHGSRKIR